MFYILALWSLCLHTWSCLQSTFTRHKIGSKAKEMRNRKSWEGFFCPEKSPESLSMGLKMLFLWGICQNIIMFICGDSKMRGKGRKRWKGKEAEREGRRRQRKREEERKTLFSSETKLIYKHIYMKQFLKFFWNSHFFKLRACHTILLYASTGNYQSIYLHHIFIKMLILWGP